MPLEIAYAICIIVSGLFVRSQIWPKYRSINRTVPKVDLSWLDGGICLWIVFVSVLVSQFFISRLLQSGFYKNYFEEDLLLRYSLLALSLQIPMILIVFGISFYKKNLQGILDKSFFMPSKEAIHFGSYAFFAYIPIILLVTLLNRYFLEQISRLGWMEMPAQQDLVEIYKTADLSISFGLLTLCTTIIAPVAEELFFRGVIYRFLKNHLNIKTSMIISGFIFAGIHMHLSVFVPLFVLGFLLAKTYEKSGNLWSCILFHALFNTQTLFVLILQKWAHA